MGRLSFIGLLPLEQAIKNGLTQTKKLEGFFMKHTKRILAIFLAFALALSLALPTMAAVDWDEFRITKQSTSMTITHGDSFTLSVEVSLPDGAGVEYQWHRRFPDGGSTAIAGATAAELRLNLGDSDYPFKLSYDEYYCKITAYEKDANGIVISSQELTSSRVRVTAEKETETYTFWEKLAGIIIMPFVELAMFFAMFVWPILSAPYLWIKGLF